MEQKLLPIIIIILVWFTGCSDQIATPTPTAVPLVQSTNSPVPTTAPPSPTQTPSPTPTSRPTATQRPSPTSTATATPTPTPTISVSVNDGTAVPQPQAIISPDNVTQVTQLARWGRGVINAIAISGDGRWLAVGTSTGVYIHDAKDLSITTDHLETTSTVEQVAISPDGTAVAVYLSEGVIQLWDVTNNQISHEIALTAMALEFSPSGGFLAVDHSDNDGGGAHVIDIETADIVQSYPGYPWVQFSPDEDEVVVWDYSQLSRYTWPENAVIDSLNPVDIGSAIGNAQYYSDSEFLMSSLPGDAGYGTKGNLLIHHGPGGNLLYEIDAIDPLSHPQTYACEESIVVFLGDSFGGPEPWQMEISADGTIAAFVYWERGFGDNIIQYDIVRFYRRETGQFLFQVGGGLEDMVMSPDSNTWFAALQDGRIQLRSLSDGSVIASTDDYDSPALHTAVSPDSQLVSIEYLDDVKIFRAENGELLYHYPARRAAFAPDGQTLLLGYEDGRLEIRNLSDNQIQRTIYAHADAVTAVAYLPNGEIVSSGLDCGFHRWNPEDGRLIQTLENQVILSPYDLETDWNLIIWQLALFEDTYLVGQTVRYMGIWQIESGQLLTVVENNNYFGYNATFANYIVTPGASMLFFEMASPDKANINWSGGQGIYAAAFSTDGTLVLSGSDRVYTSENDNSSSGVIRFWLADSGEVIHELMPGTDRVTSLAFAPNGRFFVSTTLDGDVRLWGIP